MGTAKWLQVIGFAVIKEGRESVGGAEVSPRTAHILARSGFATVARLLDSVLGDEMLWGSPIRGNAVVMYKV